MKDSVINKKIIIRERLDKYIADLIIWQKFTCFIRARGHVSIASFATAIDVPSKLEYQVQELI